MKIRKRRSEKRKGSSMKKRKTLIVMIKPRREKRKHKMIKKGIKSIRKRRRFLIEIILFIQTQLDSSKHSIVT